MIAMPLLLPSRLVPENPTEGNPERRSCGKLEIRFSRNQPFRLSGPWLGRHARARLARPFRPARSSNRWFAEHFPHMNGAWR
jgi:hypothetical protein